MQNYKKALAFEGINLNTYFTVDPAAEKAGYVTSYVGGGAETLGTIQKNYEQGSCCI